MDYSCWGERELIEELERRDAAARPSSKLSERQLANVNELVSLFDADDLSRGDLQACLEAFVQVNCRP